MPKLERKLLAHFIDASLTATPSYVRLGEDLEEYNVEMNGNINKKPNILGNVSTKLDSYQPQAGVEPYYANEGDGLFEKLQDIVDNRKVLDDLNTTVIDVHLWEEDEVTSGSYVAYKEDAVIEVISHGGDSTGYQIPFNVHYTGNRVKGLFALATKIFTPSAS
jgi:hypothetical protein